jgi:dipeptidyl aminopeptidase/acylaminoacyl peptidase
MTISRGLVGVTLSVLAACGLAASASLRVAAHAPADAAKPVVLIETLEPVLFPSEGNPPDVTRDGRWLAFGVHDRASRAERLVYVRDMTTGATRSLTDRESPDGWAKAPRWSPDGRWLAFYVRRNGRPRLAIWDRVKDKTSVVLEAPTPGLPMAVSWSERGAVLFAVTEPSPSPRPQTALPSPASLQAKGATSVTTWRSIAAKKVDAAEQSNPQSPDGSATRFSDDGFVTIVLPEIVDVLPAQDVWRIALDERGEPSVHRLVRGAAIQQIAVSPDGRSLALFGNRRLRSKGGLGATGLVDLYVMSAEPAGAASQSPHVEEEAWTTASGKTLKPIVKDVWQESSRHGMSWAPDSHAIAYVDGGMHGSGDIFVVHVPEKGLPTSARNLTQTVPAIEPSPAFAENDGYRFPKFTYGNRQPNGAPLWTADARAIVRVGGDDVWYVPVDGKTPPRNLTAREGSSHRFTSVIARVDPSGIRQAAGDRRSVLVQAIDTATFREGLWRLGLDDRSLTKVSESDATLAIGDGYGDIVESTGDIVTAKLSFNVAGEVWELAAADMAHPRQLTSLNGRPPDWLSSLVRHDVQWKTPAGQASRGILVLPASSAGGQTNGSRPAVVMHGYPGNRYATHGRWFGIHPSFEIFALLARGYAVFVFDIPMPDQDSYHSGPSSPSPMREVTDSVEAAAAALAKTGHVDAHRIVLHGHSYGGQMVNTLLGQSTMFAAGIAGAGTSNLTSSSGSSQNGMYYAENGQGGMGATLWAAPQRYVENSPVFYLDRVRAPLFLYHGERDTLVAMTEAEQMYRGLARLSRDVTLVRYRDAGHSFHDSDVRRDLFTRILAWLDTRLAPDSQSSH